MKDDINLFDYNVQDRVNDFVAAAVSQVNLHPTYNGLFCLISHYVTPLSFSYLYLFSSMVRHSLSFELAWFG